jgi:urease accessory protein UreE
MKSFSSFSDEIKKRLMKSYDEKEVIAIILKKFLKQEINKDYISINNTVLRVKVSGAQKQELKIKSKEILRLFKNAGLSITEIV